MAANDRRRRHPRCLRSDVRRNRFSISNFTPMNKKMSTEKDADAGSESVGYGSPPVHSQFKKGQSGNPKGRRKDVPISLDEAERRFLSERIAIVIGGKKLRLNRVQCVMFKL